MVENKIYSNIIRWFARNFKMKKILSRAIGFCVFLNMPVIASGESGWTDYGFVTELTPTTHQRFLVKLKIKENPGGCKDKYMFYQDYEIRGSEQMFLVLLEAVSSGKKIRVYVTGKCELNGYSEISSLGIVP